MLAALIDELEPQIVNGYKVTGGSLYKDKKINKRTRLVIEKGDKIQTYKEDYFACVALKEVVGCRVLDNFTEFNKIIKKNSNYNMVLLKYKETLAEKLVYFIKAKGQLDIEYKNHTILIRPTSYNKDIVDLIVDKDSEPCNRNLDYNDPRLVQSSRSVISDLDMESYIGLYEELTKIEN